MNSIITTAILAGLVSGQSALATEHEKKNEAAAEKSADHKCGTKAGQKDDSACAAKKDMKKNKKAAKETTEAAKETTEKVDEKASCGEATCGGKTK